MEDVLSKKKRLENLDIKYNGITLNNQDIDLMLIACADNIEQLKEALSKITNISFDIEDEVVSEERFIELRQRVFDTYLNSLTSRNEYIANNNLELSRKIDYLFKSGILSDDEISTINNILNECKSKSEIISRLKASFTDEKVHMISLTLRDFTPIEKTGIKATTLEATRRLALQIQRNYNSITIDEEAKYGKIVLTNGEYDFRHLKKSLDFARSLNKTVRLNTLLFYMDCPEELYNSENKELVKQQLIGYVRAITKFIKDNGYTDVVRSIDVFNELLNRFPLSGDTPYMYRGDIEQVSTIDTNGKRVVNDNIKSGWLRHLSIKDLCDVIAIARAELPDTDFMFNDDHLIDPKKIEANRTLLQQIKEYELRENVKLIDSIGSQMHIDSSMTKEQMKVMLERLAGFGFPIEITEFDMIMTGDLSILSPIEIEQLRQQKINEIYECVDELKQTCNIRGFTIWSKNDKQNFRVSLENEERIRNHKAPIDSLYGGYYSETMENRDIIQTFNYHTHTRRCGHAGADTDEAYIKAARDVGITQLGFSDHVPTTDLEFQNSRQQMHISDVDEYVRSIRQLQKDNPDMNIICGFEAEYNPMKEQFLGELRKKVDYMVLGQHYVPLPMGVIPSDANPVKSDYPILYADMVCRAMETGIFDIVAHPDIFMEHRDDLKSPEELEQFMENAKIASERICRTAKNLGIPLELNFGPASNNKRLNDGQLAYPHSIFWDIAAKEEALVMYGIDSHSPQQIRDMESSLSELVQHIDINKLTFVDKSYNPVTARKMNDKLISRFENSQVTSLSYEANLARLMTSIIAGKIDGQNLTIGDLPMISEEMLKKYLSSRRDAAAHLYDGSQERIQEINNDSSLSDSEKEYLINREMKAMQNYSTSFENLNGFIASTHYSIETAVGMGCKTQEEIVGMVTQLTEAETTKDEQKKETINANLDVLKKKNESPTLSTEEKGRVLALKPNNKPNPNSSSGFINMTSLIIVVALICGIILGIGYVLYRINN